MTYIDLFTKIPQEYHRNIYQKGDWMDYPTWMVKSGGIPDSVVGLCYFIFSTRFLRYYSSDWDIFSVAAIRYGDTLVLKHFHHLHTFKSDPTVYDIVTLAETNDYLYDKPLANMYYYSNIENHTQLTEKILKLLLGGGLGQTKPLSDYQYM